MQMIIANRLVDGRVVFMDADAAWVESIEDGVLLETAADNNRLMGLAMRAVEDCLIVEPYLIDLGAFRLAEHRGRPRTGRNGELVVF